MDGFGVVGSSSDGRQNGEEKTFLNKPLTALFARIFQKTGENYSRKKNSFKEKMNFLRFLHTPLLVMNNLLYTVSQL